MNHPHGHLATTKYCLVNHQKNVNIRSHLLAYALTLIAHKASDEASLMYIRHSLSLHMYVWSLSPRLPRALMKSEIMTSRIANTVILPVVGAQFNSDLIPEWKHIIHMDGFTRLRVLDDVP